MTRKSLYNLKKREKGMGKCLNLSKERSFWNASPNKYLNRNGILMHVVKNRSVLGCTFWQAGVLTLSPQDDCCFRRLSVGVATHIRTPLPRCLRLQAQAWDWEPLLATPGGPALPLPRWLSWTPIFYSSTLFLNHSPSNAILVTPTWKSEFSSLQMELTLFLSIPGSVLLFLF